MGVSVSITPDTDEIAVCCECGESLGIKETGVPRRCLDCKVKLKDKGE